MHRITLAVLAAVLALAPAAHAQSDKGAASRGAAWLAKSAGAGSDTGAADVAVALRAAGRLGGSERARRAAALRRGAASARTAGGIGKFVLGLQAAGLNGRCGAGVDLLARLNRTRRGGRYGSTLFDQALAILAVRAIGHRPPRAAISTLKRLRGGGGWSFDASQRDEVTSTGLAIQALRAAGVSRRDGTLRAGLRWLRAQRTKAGGFGHLRRDRNEANATGIALMAQRAMGVRDTRAVRALRALQRGEGAFQFSANDAGSRLLATTDAVLALSGAKLPVAARRTPAKGC